MRIDLRGLSCPAPALKAKEILESDEKKFALLVDCGAAIENVSRLLSQTDCNFEKVEHDGWTELLVEKT